MGTVAALTDPHGQVVERYRYDVFGGLLTGITAPYNTTGLTGHDFDPAAGFIDMKARWYAPHLGRFLTPDPVRGDLMVPYTQNRYVYVGNNPVNRRDPLGLMEEPGGGGGDPEPSGHYGVLVWVEPDGSAAIEDWDFFLSGTATMSLAPADQPAPSAGADAGMVPKSIDLSRRRSSAEP